MDKENVVYIYNGVLFSSAIKQEEILSFVKTYMKLLSEISQSLKDKHCMTSLVCGILVVTLLESKMVVARGQRCRKWGDVSQGVHIFHYKISSGALTYGILIISVNNIVSYTLRASLVAQ